MKVVIISDTHSQNLTTKWEIPPCEILIHCGDCSTKGREDQFSEFRRYMERLPAWLELYVPGNHDHLAATDPDKVRELLGPRIKMLIDESVTINGIKFYGSPWLKESHYFKTFTRPSDWGHIPEDTDVLITHGPPFGIMDVAERIWRTQPTGEIIEDETILDARDAEKIIERTHEGDTGLAHHIMYRVKPKLHVFGHIHEGYGATRVGDTDFVNASLVDRNYRPVNKPVVWEI